MITILIIVLGMRISKSYKLLTTAAIASLALAACGSSTEGSTTSAPSTRSATTEAGHDHEAETGHEHDHDNGADAGAKETTEAHPRLVVGTETGVSVLDHKLAMLATFPTEQRPTLTTAADGRHVLAVQNKAGVVNVVDSGSWAQVHGDHFHYYAAAPAIFDEALKGGKPVHVVGNAAADLTTVFFDATGAATLLTHEAFETKELHGLKTVGTKGPQHGVVIPLANKDMLVTQPGDKGAMPDTIELQSADGTVKDTFTCNDMHGEVVVGNTAAYGCVDSVLIIRDGKATTIPAPDASGERVGGLVTNAKGTAFLGDWGDTSLVFINNDKATVVDIGVSYTNRVALPKDQFAVLGTDGDLRTFDANGKELQKIHVTNAWTKPAGHSAVMPGLASGVLSSTPMVWVTEPDANKVHAVDIFTGKVTSADVAGQPVSIAVTNGEG